MHTVIMLQRVISESAVGHPALRELPSSLSVVDAMDHDFVAQSVCVQPQQ